jgi:hypothetical protein
VRRAGVDERVVDDRDRREPKRVDVRSELPAESDERVHPSLPSGSAVRLFAMVEPTRDDIDGLVGPATPHFAYQLRARVRELIQDLPDDHPVRKYGEEKMELLDRLGHASSFAADSDREPLSRIGWETIPSSAPAYDPLPKAE